MVCFGMRLTTKRLILRPIGLGDAAAVFEHASHPDVPRFGGFPAPRSIADTRKTVRRMAAEWKKRGPKRMAFAILLKRDRSWIGGTSLRWPHGGVGEIGYGLSPRFRGNGYAADAAAALVDLAFRRFGAHRVQATCWVKNPKSESVLRKAGLRKEGRLRGFLKQGAKVRDEYIFGITRPDWERRARR
jgi:RimJ/RimL family protein N-acetyltransferase